ncbi:Enoyl-CoA hydratase/isomerase family, putative isoform 4 [Theobroma cacao]|uniref:Enoyl-CoA hydratase/isomerase family, putative isoform 4 n=1 Tax=Theobroma cacao TaxID=3641 RepID=A0A061GIM8_THECC|nr:Enoyl-CoA hydratase/isomerase family, putative isoform 4 [Theobroma cacao]
MAGGEAHRVTMEVRGDGIAVIAFSSPPVNALHIPALTELKRMHRESMERDDVKAVVLTGAGSKFCSGLDMSLVQDIQRTGDDSVLAEISHDLIDQVEDGKKPSVAAIQGYALGAGLELSMGCCARVATPGAKLGLPELTLGFSPGLGGTQRLPRLVGVSKAAQMLLTSKPVMSEEGKSLGLIDAIASPEELLEVACDLALDIVESRRPRLSSLSRTDKLGSTEQAMEILEGFRQGAKETAHTMPEKLACLDVIGEGITSGGRSGVLKEMEVFRELVLSTAAKALVHVSCAQRATSQVRGVTDAGLKPRPIGKVGVIGAGLMGSGITTALILSNIHVVLKELNSEYLQRGIKKIEANLQALVTKGKLDENGVKKALSFLRGVSDYSEFKDVDLVIEAVIEDLSLKQSIFEEIDKVCPPHCILASGTSGIDLNKIGERTSSQDRIVGAHFFSPAHIMPLLEIVRTEKTSTQVLLDLMTIGKAIKKVPLIVGNCTGFAVNRTFSPYFQGPFLLADLGVDIFRIDRVVCSFGLSMGPYLLHDVTGYGLAIAFAKEMAATFPDRTFQSALHGLMLQHGRQGKSNGKGYYIFEKGSKPKPDYTVQPIVEESRRITNLVENPISISDQEIVEMIFFPVVNEGCRIIEEGVIARASELDVASVLGFNFPSRLGGIMFWADTIGAKYIYTSLKKWSALYGPFFRPSRFLEERAMKGIPLVRIGIFKEVLETIFFV